MGAKADFGPIKKDKKGARSAYASLDSVLAATEPHLLKHGLALVQLVNGPMLDTYLYHESGQYLLAQHPIELGADGQRNGSAITYARRYSICALLSVTADEDDDGEACSPSAQQSRRSSPRSPRPEPKGNPVAAQVRAIVNYATNHGMTVDDVRKLCRDNGLPERADDFTTAGQAASFEAILQQHLQALQSVA
jgi:hypothetical protein